MAIKGSTFKSSIRKMPERLSPMLRNAPVFSTCCRVIWLYKKPIFSYGRTLALTMDFDTWSQPMLNASTNRITMVLINLFEFMITETNEQKSPVLTELSAFAPAYRQAGFSFYLFLKYLKSLPINFALSPNSSSMRSNWLYFAILSDRDNEPVLICPQFKATARSAMVESSVSPERWLITDV